MEETKYLSVLKSEEDKDMFSKISGFMSRLKSGHTRIQIENFILNDIEYPTEYGKFQQVRVELLSRYQRVIESYFEFKELDIKLRRADRNIEEAEDELDRELAVLEKERLILRKATKDKEMKDLLREAKVFYEKFMEYEKFHELSEEEEFQLEARQWAEKALNQPLIFEERYGEDFLKKAWGEDLYNSFKALRQKSYGLLPREMFSKLPQALGQGEAPKGELPEGERTEGERPEGEKEFMVKRDLRI